MKSHLPLLAFLAFGGLLLLSATAQEAPTKKKGGKKGDPNAPKKVELAHPFYWAAPDAYRGDWQGDNYVAQVMPVMDRVLSVQDQIPQQSDVGRYVANVFHKFDQPNDKPVAVMQGELSGSSINFTGDGWTGAIADGRFKAS